MSLMLHYQLYCWKHKMSVGEVHPYVYVGIKGGIARAPW